MFPKTIMLIVSTTALLAACASPSGGIAPAQQTSETPTLTFIETPTSAPTETPLPTLTPTPEPTPIPLDETDLEPNFVEEVHAVFMGAQIDSKLITDKSLDPIIKQVTVPENVWAQFMATSIYEVWEASHPGVPLEAYMQIVAEVQNEGRDPMNIAIPIYANDMNDGIPYQKEDGSVNPEAQEKYWVVPWFSGEVPTEVDGVKVRAVSEINVALVNGKKVKNIDIVGDPYSIALGTNLDEDTLYIYEGLPLETYVGRPNLTSGPASMLSVTATWLKRKSPRGFLPNVNKSLEKLLLDGGIRVN